MLGLRAVPEYSSDIRFIRWISRLFGGLSELSGEFPSYTAGYPNYPADIRVMQWISGLFSRYSGYQGYPADTRIILYSDAFREKCVGGHVSQICYPYSAGTDKCAYPAPMEAVTAFYIRAELWSWVADGQSPLNDV